MSVKNKRYTSIILCFTLIVISVFGMVQIQPRSIFASDNLALNADVTASSDVGGVWASANIVDGNKACVGSAMGWSSAGDTSTDHEEYVVLDLKQVKDFNQVVIYPRDDGGMAGQFYPVNFKIEISDNNTDWQQVCSANDIPLPGTPFAQTYDFSINSARYIKIIGTKLRPVGTEYRMQLAEVEVYKQEESPNLARRAVFTASSELPAPWEISNLNDGKVIATGSNMGFGTNSDTGEDHTEWIVADMKQPREVSCVVLYSREDGQVKQFFPVDFTIDVSEDGTSWNTVVTKTDYPEPDAGVGQVFFFEKTTARYVRLYATSLRNSGEYRLMLSEFEIYNVNTNGGNFMLNADVSAATSEGNLWSYLNHAKNTDYD